MLLKEKSNQLPAKENPPGEKRPHRQAATSQNPLSTSNPYIHPVPLEMFFRERAIVRKWPRDPNRPNMTATPFGKVAGNNQPLWGATLFDFFFVSGIPSQAKLATGSKWVKEFGELEHPKGEIGWAEREAEPKELLPYDMAALIEEEDRCLPALQESLDESSIIVEGRRSAMHYEKMQNRIPFHLLPEKLIVHDPDDTLHAGSGPPRSPEERLKPHIYSLQLTQETRDAIAAERAKLAQAAEDVSVTSRLFPAEHEDANGTPKEGPNAEAIYAVFPPAPPTSLSTPEAHLYINSAEILGKGNHSHVYRATWEIPRSLVLKPYVCDLCISQALLKKLREEAPEATVDETQPLNAQLTALIAYITAKHKGKETASTRQVPIDVKWTTPGNFCEHEAARNSAPLTFKASVSAKLSLEDDAHLPREARNYQRFPTHLFQHWSGYIVVPPMYDPTPALAVVPQFYGYYVPEAGAAGEGEYLSPIMLLEDCGTPIDVDDLGLDDRHECASLLFRMHCEGWVHNSVFPRNILVQHGAITDSPTRRDHDDRRFRLIDFGRSEYCLEGEKESGFGVALTQEEWECQEMFKIINFAENQLRP